MSPWSNENPGAGSTAGSASSITALSGMGSTIDDVYTRSVAAVSAANDDKWSGSAGTAWRMKARGVVRVLPDLKDSYSSALSAIADYQSTVNSIRSRAEPLRTELEHARSTFWVFEEVRPPWDLQGIADDALGKVRNLQTQWDNTHALANLARERQAADDALVGILDALVDLSPDTDVATRLGSGTPNSTDLFTDASLGKLSDADLLALLGALTATELAALLNDHPSIGERIARQSPEVIREWWGAYYEQEPNLDDPMALTPKQRAIVSAMPLIIGNLDGIPYTHRDIANLEAHEQVLDDLQYIQEQSYRILEEDGVGAFDEYLTKHGYDSNTLQNAIDGELAIDRALAEAGEVTYQFVQYQPGPPLLAAISVGNMDTASQVTVNVPGMGTTVGDSMEAWTAGARNLYEQQSDLNDQYGQETGLAVVSWIGYETPVMATTGNPEVILSDKAVVGAAKLTDFLTGVTGTRDWDAGQNLSVVGHSYGTTVATLAVHGTPVETLTLLASAGVDNSITSVDDLKVDPDHFWASEAKGDNIADVGRGEVTIYMDEYGNRVQLKDFPAWEHSVDPKLVGFGGHVFSSEDSGDLQGSDWHSAMPQSEAEISGKTDEDQYGYLDRGTTPIYNTGVSSLGLDPALMVKP